MRPYALVSASLAPVALIGGWTVAAMRQPAAYDATRDTISALAAHGASDRWVMTAGLAVLGGCHVVTAIGLDDAKPLGRALLAAGGVSAALVAVFAQPSAAHFPVATGSFVLLAVWPAASAIPDRTTGWIAAAGLTGLLAWFGLRLDGPDVGLVERVVAGGQSLWPLAAAVLTWRAARTRRRATR